MHLRQRISNACAEVEQTVIAHRRHLHAHPEISFQEVQTRKYIQEQLDALEIPYVNVEGFCGVVATIRGDKPGKTIAFRADIDALSLQEENDLPYRSLNDGVMHACGHDGHAAVLLGLAEIFTRHRDLAAGEIRLIFQHGEELPPGGAAEIVRQGFLKGVDAVFGLHIWTHLDLGLLGYNTGGMMACTDRFSVEVKGSGGHAGAPHRNNDALVAGAALVMQLQTIISRRVRPLSPAVVSVCRFHSGSAFNIIAERTAIEGTVRTTDEGARAVIREQIHRISNGVGETYGVSCAVHYEEGYPVLVNDKQVTLQAVECIGALTDLAPTAVPPNMGGEDFAYFTQEAPGTYFFVGSRNKAAGLDKPHHNPRFNFDEAALSHAISAFLAAYLSQQDC